MTSARAQPVSLEDLRLQAAALDRTVFVYPQPRAAGRVHRRAGLTAHLRYLDDFTRFYAERATGRADDADLFFVPISMISFQFLNVVRRRRSWVRDPDIGRLVEGLSHLGRAPHVLLSTGDFGQRARSPWESMAPHRAYPEIYEWLDERFRLLLFEFTEQSASIDVGILPYPLDPMPHATERDLLYSFAGVLGYPDLPINHIRGQQFERLRVDQDDAFVGSTAEAITRAGPDAGTGGLISRSTFTLCPGGYGRWTFRLGQAVAAGSIPVVIADGYVLPHSQFIDWADCAVVVPEANVADIPAILRGLSLDEVERRQAALHAHRHLFTGEAVHLMSLLELTSRAPD